MAKKYLGKADVIEMAVAYFPSFLRSRQHAIRLDKWMNGKQHELNDASDEVDIDRDDPMYGMTYAPRAEETTGEYDNLQAIAPNNFAGLLTTTLAQTAYMEGIRRTGQKGPDPAWETMRRNRILAKQSSVHRTAIGMGQAFGVRLPGVDPLTKAPQSKILLRSPKTMAAFYDNDDDEWPVIAIEAKVRYETMEGLGRNMPAGWYVTIYDDYVLHRLTCKGNGLTADDWNYIDFVEHGTPVPPVARLANRLDLDGRAYGEIEPVLPILRRIDQDVFDRLIIQRFGAWQVRYIAGMAKPSKASEERAQALMLRVQDLLVSTDPNTSFGTLPGGPLEPMIGATDADLRLLSAISQTPPHHLLGLSSNLQAEALAAAEAGLQRKSFDFRTNADQFYVDLARLDAMGRNDMAAAAAYDYSVRWRDTESRSMTQAADALGKLAVQLKVPLEMLWEKIPGWTDDDVARAKELVEDGTFETLIQELMDGQDNPGDQQQTGGTGGDGQ